MGKASARTAPAWASAVAVFAAVGLHGADADAGGFYFSDRGVRPMGRAGAFVAGADDLNATYYNPAGIKFWASLR